MSNARVWLFRSLILIAIGLLFVSWFLPWWKCTTPAMEGWVRIRPWGLENNLGIFAVHIDGSDMPGWFGPFMWAYLGLCTVLLLVSLFVKDKVFRFCKIRFSLPHTLLAGVGLSYIVVAILAVVIAAIRSGDYFNMSLIGFTYVEEAYGNVYGSLQLGYWLACATGPLLLLLSLFRNKIIGKSSISQG